MINKHRNGLTVTIVFVLNVLLQPVAVASNCILSMKQDLTYNQPLILSTTSGSWYPLTNTPTGSLQFTRDEYVKFICPTPPTGKNAFSSFPNTNEVLAKCHHGSSFEIDKKVYTFDQLQCQSPVKPTTQKTGQQCLGDNTELIKVGYKAKTTFVTAYEVCFDKSRLSTSYAQAVVSPDIEKNDAPVKEATWTTDNELFNSMDLDSDYACDKQKETFKRILSKDYFGDGDNCCLAKTQLVNAADLASGPQQIATYHYLNTIPQWSTCNKANWNEVEKRIRTLAKNLQRPLTVWSGTYRIMTISGKWSLLGFNNKDMYIHYNSKSDKGVAVPLLIWKVIYDPQTQKAVAVIEINNPKLALTDIESYIRCDNICENVNWLNFLQRKTISNGYVYCCDLNDFEFGMAFTKSPFPKPNGGLLRDDTRLVW